MAKILLVDDDQDFLDSTRLTLVAAQFEVDTALTPEESLQKLRTTRYDLVVLDVMMPEGHEGFEIAKAIRENLKLRELPIVILSAIHHAKQVPYRFAPDDDYLPVDVFLDKPVEGERLIGTIEEVLGRRREEPKQPL
jgi:DNA-binding response OmpR family regulator